MCVRGGVEKRSEQRDLRYCLQRLRFVRVITDEKVGSVSSFKVIHLCQYCTKVQTLDLAIRAV